MSKDTIQYQVGMPEFDTSDDKDFERALEAIRASSKLGAPGIVFPPDTRVKVNDTTQYPFSSIGLLITEFKSGNVYAGTGVLIANEFVLTAGHNLYGSKDGGWAKYVWFCPAANGSVNNPYKPIAAKNFYVSEDYRTLSPPNPNNNNGNVDTKDVTRYLYDYGLIKLKSHPPVGANIYMYAASDAELKKEDVLIAGYPGDKEEYTMWKAHGKVQPDELFLFYQISTYRGESGAGLLIQTGDIAPRAYRNTGIHIAGDPVLQTNFAVRITDDVVSNVEKWMKNM